MSNNKDVVQVCLLEYLVMLFFRFSAEFTAERILQNRSLAVEVMNYLTRDT